MTPSSSKKILLVISKFPPEYSGPGVRIPRLYTHLKNKGLPYTIRVLCNGIEKTKSENYEYESFPVHRIVPDFLHSLLKHLPILPAQYKHAIFYQFEFIKTLFFLFFSATYKQTDLVHLAGYSGGTAAALVWAKIKDIPVLMELVTAKAPYRQKFFFFFKTPVPNSFKIIALTNPSKERCISEGLDIKKIWQRPNPIDESIFSPPSKKEKEKIRKHISPFTKDHVVLANVGKMIPQKNQILAVEILKHLPNRYAAIIAGPLIDDGPLKERDLSYVEDIKTRIKNYGLEDRIHFLTDFVNAPDYMKAADIYLMPAWNEGFGTPMIEAMGCGLPVIGNANEPAFQEWIEDNKNGFLCDIAHAKDWAQAIEQAAEVLLPQSASISDNIHKKAGQKAIYFHYEEVINQLLKT